MYCTCTAHAPPLLLTHFLGIGWLCELADQNSFSIIFSFVCVCGLLPRTASVRPTSEDDADATRDEGRRTTLNVQSTVMEVKSSYSSRTTHDDDVRRRRRRSVRRTGTYSSTTRITQKTFFFFNGTIPAGAHLSILNTTSYSTT